MNARRYRLLLLALLIAGAVVLVVWRDRVAFELGHAYAHGDFHGWRVPRDDIRAAHWLRRAAEADHPRAQYFLGLYYSRGWGLKQDDALAAYWFNRAAGQAYAPACFHLAWMLHKGEGVARDEARAQRLMARAAALGMKEAAVALGHFRAQGAPPPLNGKPDRPVPALR